jgi:hypothetical protein
MVRAWWRVGGGDFTLTEFASDKVPRYAIISQTGGADREEVTLRGLVNDVENRKEGRSKAVDFCEDQAAVDSGKTRISLSGSSLAETVVFVLTTSASTGLSMWFDRNFFDENAARHRHGRSSPLDTLKEWPTTIKVGSSSHGDHIQILLTISDLVMLF